MVSRDPLNHPPYSLAILATPTTLLFRETNYTSHASVSRDPLQSRQPTMIPSPLHRETADTAQPRTMQNAI